MIKPKVLLEWIGPVGHEQRLDGQVRPLEPGERYLMEADLAHYLCEHNPDHWRQPEIKGNPDPPGDPKAAKG